MKTSTAALVATLLAVTTVLTACTPAPSEPAPTPSSPVPTSATPSASPDPTLSAAPATLPDTPVLLTITGAIGEDATSAGVEFEYVAHVPQPAGSAEYEQIVAALVASGDTSLLTSAEWRATNAQYLQVIDISSALTTANAWSEPGLAVVPGPLVSPDYVTAIGLSLATQEGRFGYGYSVPVGPRGVIIAGYPAGPDGAWESYPASYGVRIHPETIGYRIDRCEYSPTPAAVPLESQPEWFDVGCWVGWGYVD